MTARKIPPSRRVASKAAKSKVANFCKGCDAELDEEERAFGEGLCKLCDQVQDDDDDELGFLTEGFR